MPGFDRTGPTGQGPRTGRGLGQCGRGGGSGINRSQSRRNWFGQALDNFRGRFGRRSGGGRRGGRGQGNR